MTDESVFDAFFDDALDSFASAANTAPPRRDYSLAGEPFGVTYASEAMRATIDPAMAHLAVVPADVAQFTIHAWAGDRSGAQLPLPPWDAVPFFERGNVRGFHGAKCVLAYDRRSGVFSAVHHERQIGLYWSPDINLSHREQAAPFRRLLPAWRSRDGLFAVHAGAVGYADGGALLAGRTGSGKSTTAVLCVGSSLGFAGDDLVLLEPGTVPYVHSLSGSAKLNRGVLDWKPGLRSAVVNADPSDVDKALVHVAVEWPAQVCTGFPLKVLLLTRPTDGVATVARPVPAEHALKALLPDTLFTALGPPRIVAHGLADVVRSVPCFDLVLGTDVDGVTDAIEQVLREYR